TRVTPPSAAIWPSTQARWLSAASGPALFSSIPASNSLSAPMSRMRAGRSSGRASRMATVTSEPFLALLPHGIRAIAIKREFDVLDERIDAVVIALDGLGPRRHPVEGAVELGEVCHLDHEMELAETGRCKPELLAHQPPAFDDALRLEPLHVFREGVHE